VANLVGGYEAWVAEGFEVEPAKPARTAPTRRKR
jgi:hypothetical protein